MIRTEPIDQRTGLDENLKLSEGEVNIAADAYGKVAAAIKTIPNKAFIGLSALLNASIEEAVNTDTTETYDLVVRTSDKEDFSGEVAEDLRVSLHDDPKFQAAPVGIADADGFAISPKTFVQTFEFLRIFFDVGGSAPDLTPRLVWISPANPPL